MYVDTVLGTDRTIRVYMLCMIFANVLDADKCVLVMCGC